MSEFWIVYVIAAAIDLAAIAVAAYVAGRAGVKANLVESEGVALSIAASLVPWLNVAVPLVLIVVAAVFGTVWLLAAGLQRIYATGRTRSV